MVALVRPIALSSEIITEPARLAALTPEWDRLLERSDLDAPTVSPLWIEAWWRVFGAGRRLRVVALRDAGRLVGLAPLAVRVRWVAHGLPVRRLELLPSGEPTADEIASDEIGVAVERGHEQRVAEALAGLLAGGALGRWDELVMPALSLDSMAVPLLATALERAGRVAFDVTSSSPIIPLPPRWDDYLARLSGSRRRRLVRTLRGFERWSDGDHELRVVATADELPRGAAILRRLHQARWQADGRAGVFASPRFTAFHDLVMPRLLERGALELMWLVARGQPVAALYNIQWNGKIHFYQSGRLPDLPPDVRPGLVIHALAIQRAIAAGHREYDFLPGSARYKLDLALATRPIGRIRVVRARWLDRARVVARRGAGILRAWRAPRPRAGRSSG